MAHVENMLFISIQNEPPQSLVSLKPHNVMLFEIKHLKHWKIYEIQLFDDLSTNSMDRIKKLKGVNMALSL